LQSSFFKQWEICSMPSTHQMLTLSHVITMTCERSLIVLSLFDQRRNRLFRRWRPSLEPLGNQEKARMQIVACHSMILKHHSHRVTACWTTPWKQEFFFAARALNTERAQYMHWRKKEREEGAEERRGISLSWRLLLFPQCPDCLGALVALACCRVTGLPGSLSCLSRPLGWHSQSL
jgi:hypothetical protein